MLFSDIVSQQADAYGEEKKHNEEAAVWERERLEKLRAENRTKLDVLAQITAWAQDKVPETIFASTAYGVDLVFCKGEWFARAQCEMHSLDCTRGLMLLSNFQFGHFAQIAARVVELSDTLDLELPWIPVPIGDPKPPG
jgi:hypothetical protein